MLFPATTAVFAALLALVYVGLSAWVIAGRTTLQVLEGDGGNESLRKRIRAHANFGEYVPLAVLVIGLLEAAGGSHALVITLAALLLAGRLLHPFGMFAAPNSARRFACRGGGMIATLLALAVGAVALLLRVL